MRALLLIETSTEAASVALVLEGKLVAEKGFVSDRRHNALLFGPLAEILGEYGRKSFDAVLVGGGPGSYSGTRVGIAAAQGAAFVGGCKAVALPSILAIPPVLAGGDCLVVGDARRGSYWTAKTANGSLVQEPTLTDEFGLEVALDFARQRGVGIVSMDRFRDPEIPHVLPTAGGLWQAWENAPAQDRAVWAGRVPQPIYLAPPHITASRKISYGRA